MRTLLLPAEQSLVRCQNGKMARRVQDLETNRERLCLQINASVAQVSQERLLDDGLFNIPNSPAKFGMIIAKLKASIEQVEDCNYSDAMPYLTLIYGKKASLRGAGCQFVDLMRLEERRREALRQRRPWPPPGDPVFREKDAPTDQVL